MHVFCMHVTSMGSIRKRSSVSPQTKDVNVGIMLKHTVIILKYLRSDKRNRGVHSENGFINCKVREGGWVQLILFFHLISANVKPRVTPTGGLLLFSDALGLRPFGVGAYRLLVTISGP